MSERDDEAMTGEPAPAGAQRLDKWLWYARVVKSRTLAAKLVTDGHVRINRERVAKASHAVRPGDVVTASVHRHVRVLCVKAPGVRRGPAEEARGLYEDLTPPPRPDPASPTRSGRERGTGRPTKRDRRAIDDLQRRR